MGTYRLAGHALALLAVPMVFACGPKPERPLQGYIEGEYVRVAAPFAGTLQTVVGEAWRSGRQRRAGVRAGTRK
jgi:HlyD family secretion protein